MKGCFRAPAGWSATLTLGLLHVFPSIDSAHLRKWCEQNKNQYYVPEWLLKAWNISVNSDLTGAA